MHPARIAELLEPYLGPPDARRLKPDALESISTYIDILQHWNSRVNLTAIRDEEEIVTRHFGESLFAARHLFPLWNSVSSVVKASRVADIGSGAGFPGVPIKIWAPEISLTLIESNHKKATFLKEITRALTLTDINIQTVRVESLTSASYDVVTLRAVERFEAILPTAARLAATNGRLALLIGSAQLASAKSAVPNITWSPSAPIPVSQNRILAVGKKNEHPILQESTQ